MITDWNGVKVKHLIEINRIKDLDATEDEKNLMVAGLLSDIPYEKLLAMPLDKVQVLTDGIEFMRKPIPTSRARNHYEINGHRYWLLKNPNEMTVSQYIDYKNVSALGFETHIPEMLAIMLIPEGKNYNDNYDTDQVRDDILEMGVVEALGVAGFFIKRFQRSILRSQTYLQASLLMAKWKLRRVKDKELRKALELEMNLLMEELR